MRRSFRTIITAALAAVSFSALAGVIGGPADGMCPAVTDHGPCINHALDPTPSLGDDALRVKETKEEPAGPGDIGAVRWTCTLAGINHDDPLVWPGKQNATHAHVYFGAVGVNAFTTDPAQLATMRSTCRGGTVDQSAMWMPAMVDTGTGEIVAPSGFMKYYKSGYNGILPSQLRTIPNGFTMIAGDAKNREKKGPIVHKCDGKDPVTGRSIPSQAGPDIPDCPVGAALIAEIGFPQCVKVDEQGAPVLDSPDHKSHVAYTVSPPNAAPLDSNGLRVTQYANGRWCPVTHPYPIPEVRLVVTYPKVTEAGQLTRYRYSSDMYHLDAAGNVIPGGRSFHADYRKQINEWAWDSIMERLRGGYDLHGHLIGNGWMTY